MPENEAEDQEAEKPKKGTKEELADRLRYLTEQDIKWESLTKEELEQLVSYYSQPRKVIRNLLTKMVDIHEKLSFRQLADRMDVKADEMMDRPIGKLMDEWEFPILGAFLKKVL